MTIQTQYLDKLFKVERFRKVIEKSCDKLRLFAETTPFDAIACTGTSGVAVAFPLSLALNKPVICVRKQVSSHYGKGEVEGYVGSGNYVIVDDCIDSGATVAKIIAAVSNASKAKLVGVLLYDQPWGEQTLKTVRVDRESFYRDGKLQVPDLDIPVLRVENVY